MIDVITNSSQTTPNRYALPFSLHALFGGGGGGGVEQDDVCICSPGDNPIALACQSSCQRPRILYHLLLIQLEMFRLSLSREREQRERERER